MAPEVMNRIFDPYVREFEKEYEAAEMVNDQGCLRYKKGGWETQDVGSGANLDHAIILKRAIDIQIVSQPIDIAKFYR
jgi:hypothetical protein